jgi:hypothetical protein
LLLRRNWEKLTSSLTTPGEKLRTVEGSRHRPDGGAAAAAENLFSVRNAQSTDPSSVFD